MKNIITITTDFGDNFSLAQLYGVIYSINPSANVVTLSNEVEPFNIRQGAFIIQENSKVFPDKTIYVGVVDPGVGSKRDAVIVETNKSIYVGPDNGLFYPSIKSETILKQYVIDERKVAKNHSQTFHGRDVFSVVAAKISLGEEPSSFAKKRVDNLVPLAFKKNEIVLIDDYGNIKVQNNCSTLKVGDTFIVQIRKREVEIPFVRTFSDVKVGDLLGYRGSNDLLEIAVSNGSASEKIGIQLGDILNLK